MQDLSSHSFRPPRAIPADDFGRRLLARLHLEEGLETFMDTLVFGNYSPEARFFLRDAFIRWEDTLNRLKAEKGPVDPLLTDLCVNYELVPVLLSRKGVHTVLSLYSPPNKEGVRQLLEACEKQKLYDAIHLRFLLSA